MNLLEQLDRAVAYIEAHLCDEIDMDELARIACVTADSFARFFSYICGMTLQEYIRRRRLTRAAYEIQGSDSRVIDIAVKYGYNSADAFTKAFLKQHGITPTQARGRHQPLKVYPPVSFHIMVKGAKEMRVRVIETKAVRLRGLSKRFTGLAADRFAQEHVMWGIELDDYARRINPEIGGTWYGIWDNGTYWIAKAEEEAVTADTEEVALPAGTWAVFSTGYGGFAGDELPGLRELIFDSWLPDSGYAQAGDYEVEVYHLFPKEEKGKRHYEIWVPVCAI